MLSQLVTILFIMNMVAHASLGYTDNVGSVLFSPADLQKDHWSKAEIGLLRARRYFQELLPPPNFIDTTNEDNIDKLIRYFRDTYSTIKKEAEDEVSNNIMTTAFSDAVGGYLKMWVLPITKLGFYGGTVSQNSIIKLYQFHDELNRYLDTDGAGWHSPDKSLLHTITVGIAPPRHITRSMKDACKQLAYYEKSRTGLDIPTPYINWADKNSIMFVPLKNQSLIPLHSPDYPNVISKYYDTAKNCLGRDAYNPYVSNQFDDRFQTWLTKDVVPHLSDDNVYLAFGNVLSLMNKSHDRHSWREPKLYYLGHTVMVAGIPIDMSSKKIILILIILLLEVIWCIPALLYLTCTRKKKKGGCCSLITEVRHQKSGYDRNDKYTCISRSYKISDINKKCFKTPQKLNSGIVSPEFKRSIVSSTSVNVIQEVPLKSSINKKRTSHGSHLNTVSPKPSIASSAKVNVHEARLKSMKNTRISQLSSSHSQHRTLLRKPSTTSSASVNVIHEVRLKSFVKKSPNSHVQESHQNTVSPKYDNKVSTCSECSRVDESITNIESFYTETEIDKRHEPSSEPVTFAESVSSKLETASHTTYVKSFSNTSSEKLKIIDYVEKLSTGETAKEYPCLSCVHDEADSFTTVLSQGKENPKTKECPCLSCVHDEADSLITLPSQLKENPKTSLEAHIQMQLSPPPMQPKQPMHSTQPLQSAQSTQLMQLMQSTQLMQPMQSTQLMQLMQSTQFVQPMQSSKVKENYYKNAELRLQSVQPYFEITVNKPRLAEISVDIFDPSKSVAKRSKIPKRLPMTVPVQKTVGSTLKKAGAEPKLKSLIPRPVDDLVIKSSKTKGEPAREWPCLSCLDDEADNLIFKSSSDTRIKKAKLKVTAEKLPTGEPVREWPCLSCLDDEADNLIFKSSSDTRIKKAKLNVTAEKLSTGEPAREWPCLSCLDDEADNLIFRSSSDTRIKKVKLKVTAEKLPTGEPVREWPCLSCLDDEADNLIFRSSSDTRIKKVKLKITAEKLSTGEPAREWSSLICLDDEADNPITLFSHETPSPGANSEGNMVADILPQLTQLTQTTQCVQPKQPTKLTDVKNNYYKNVGLRLELRPRIDIIIEKSRRRDISIDIDDEKV